ncbi:MAG: precorrin-2 dehydrogenase [Thermoanaerobacteraceae bacterium]|jgi:siroheme synthase-like protein|uniref:precorrin-2 dehydrogenase n=1 Tax=Biomaibacter acetigenes TaxID=2316383 RepID=A0A3G2R2Z6_9FIRM|nr:bifunctional precorrin-2 dehydrogenase/sirohydrochlorin ferrochelatase [Biomaibacter acetigenes]AYO29691.1 bifunctional precorrin-2 dehydrogenase/sirohydrochlorin ferrochelatase [Biomaibacter acetigenes]MDK2879619.1 precorrin-2 dehydrogenase [Thermoanaerobacteraceae bacterium]MDN5311926.1 precorrin-2 dehydrogenase [Thermoanaerobacteraceae bacterium]
MAYYPVMLNIEGKRCLVVGGGSVAHRKVLSLLECGAIVTVIAPEVNESILKLWKEARIRLIRRNYIKSDLAGYFIVVAASDDRDVNKLIAEEAGAGGVLVNVVDDGELSSFIMPSVIRRGDLTVAISTGGKSPLLSKMLRQKLEEILPAECEELLKKLGKARESAKEKGLPSQEKLKIYKDMIEDSELKKFFKNGG